MNDVRHRSPIPRFVALLGAIAIPLLVLVQVQLRSTLRSVEENEAPVRDGSGSLAAGSIAAQPRSPIAPVRQAMI